MELLAKDIVGSLLRVFRAPLQLCSTLTVNQTEATRSLGVHTILQPIDSEYWSTTREYENRFSSSHSKEWMQFA